MLRIWLIFIYKQPLIIIIYIIVIILVYIIVIIKICCPNNFLSFSLSSWIIDKRGDGLVTGGDGCDSMT